MKRLNWKSFPCYIIIGWITMQAGLAMAESDRAQTEAQVLSIFSSQMSDNGVQLSIALQNATQKQLNELLDAPDVATVNIILGGREPSLLNFAQRAADTAQRVGDLDKDYTFTPIAPCRIVDTRKPGANGAFDLNETRDYFIYGNGTLLFPQGGINTGCNSPVGEPYAAMISMVAVPVSGGGTFTAYPADEDAPSVGSLLNYQSLDPSLAVVSATTVKTFHSMGNPEIQVKNRFGRAHLVIDVLGYFTVPETNDGVDFVGGDQSILLPSTATIIRSLSVDMPKDGFCIINASGSVYRPNTGGTTYCSITTETTVDFTNAITSAGSAFGYDSLGATRGFTQAQGNTTYNLVCQASLGSNNRIYDTQMTSVCSANRF